MNNHMRLTIVGQDRRVELNDPASSTYLQAELTGLTTLPSIRTTSGQNIGIDGGWTSAQFYDARLISVQGVIANKDVAVVEQKRKELLSILTEKNLKLEFQTEAGNEYSIDVVVSSVTMPLGQLLIASNFKIDFRADDPLIYDNTNGGVLKTELTTTISEDSGFTLNFPLNFQLGNPISKPTVNNFGTSAVYPIIRLYGVLHTPKIINSTTNQYIEISDNLTASDVVEIDTKAHTITLNGANIFSHITDGSEWITLAVGNNEFMMSSSNNADTGKAEIEYRVGYMGI